MTAQTISPHLWFDKEAKEATEFYISAFPTVMDKMMHSGSSKQIARATQKFLKMKKFDIADLQKTYDSK